MAKELGETMTAEELAEMLERAASNGRDITREDFYNIMVKKTFWIILIKKYYYNEKQFKNIARTLVYLYFNQMFYLHYSTLLYSITNHAIFVYPN